VNIYSSAVPLACAIAIAMAAALPAHAHERDRSGYMGSRPSYPAYPAYVQPPAAYPQSPFTYGPPPAVYSLPGGPFLTPPPQPVYPGNWPPQYRTPDPQRNHSWNDSERRDHRYGQRRDNIDDYRWRGDQDHQQWGSRNR
jgi:hypothetical protein